MIMVMGLAERGDLRHVVQSSPNLSWQIKVQMACGVANGLRALHDMRLIHRDIKEMMLLPPFRPLPGSNHSFLNTVYRLGHKRSCRRQFELLDL
jgi:serine/threonine protein kinase